jgi:acyl-CoA reductase-like NAD-dependent aldehyde dehydrogenase
MMRKAAAILRETKPRLAATMTAEMGKPIVESEAEIEKCAVNCNYRVEGICEYSDGVDWTGLDRLANRHELHAFRFGKFVQFVASALFLL